ncbi:hypothetical protein L226DRAFT_554814 [Lentinus tigrinus ALCF2SS1-7]|uniref:uncharacterized protein n=1 Tax=Lentinus tigrinus ALCF2SS1-7 TaxID=1328758 RepID=UPI0011660EE8|nr:hypothetical protein L226DRAFT_554814 [Lentinus tigrinus ALCF2SS1-7]
MRDLGKLFAPTICTYAVIRMNPKTMASEEAALMSPRKYLVFLDAASILPWPGSPYYEYSVRPIAPCLRKEDKEDCITPDMYHRRGREPIHSDPEFPFSNCYHWLNYGLRLRIRARFELFDHGEAVMLSDEAYAALDKAFNED